MKEKKKSFRIRRFQFHIGEVWTNTGTANHEAPNQFVRKSIMTQNRILYGRKEKRHQCMYSHTPTITLTSHCVVPVSVVCNASMPYTQRHTFLCQLCSSQADVECARASNMYAHIAQMHILYNKSFHLQFANGLIFRCLLTWKYKRIICLHLHLCWVAFQQIGAGAHGVRLASGGWIWFSISTLTSDPTISWMASHDTLYSRAPSYYCASMHEHERECSICIVSIKKIIQVVWIFEILFWLAYWMVSVCICVCVDVDDKENIESAVRAAICYMQ